MPPESVSYFATRPYNESTGIGQEYEDSGIENLLLEEKYQNADWFQVTNVTLVHYNIIQSFNIQKMSNASISVDAFATQLSTRWGVGTRGEQGSKPLVNTIPPLYKFRSTAAKMSGNYGDRNVLNAKRLSDALVKGNMVMIINEHFRGGTVPKYVAIYMR